VNFNLVAPVASASLGFAYGVAHGLGPDHLAALGTLLARGRDRRHALAACVRFGVGHAIVLGALGAASVLTGWLIPTAWERAAEAAGGALLVVLGAIALLRSVPVVIHRHAHTHEERADEDDEAHAHEHWHLHAGDPARHRHAHPAVIGGALAMSGVRSLVLTLSPLLLAGRSPVSAFAFVLSFGLGVVASMIAFGLLFHVGRRQFSQEITGMAVGGGSLLLGTWWLWSSAI
jgi:cytochrome c biogenesis protein CcdA